MSRKIQKILKDWKAESGADRVIQFKYRDGILTIYSSQPGLLIGRSGVIVNKYRQIFAKELYDFKELKFVETDYYWA